MERENGRTMCRKGRQICTPLQRRFAREKRHQVCPTARLLSNIFARSHDNCQLFTVSWSRPRSWRAILRWSSIQIRFHSSHFGAERDRSPKAGERLWGIRLCRQPLPTSLPWSPALLVVSPSHVFIKEGAAEAEGWPGNRGWGQR